MTVDEALEVARQGAAMGCREALFTLGEKPELRHPAARQSLDEMGFDTTLDYVAHVAGRVLDDTGLLPHINAGCMTVGEIRMLRKVSASMGLMLESSSSRLCEKGQVHYGSPDKDPVVRLETLENAGREGVPFTTGILIGIGETREERLDSLLAIRQLHLRYGHIQEVIVQNFIPKADTKMANVSPPDHDELRWTIAMARIIFGPEMSIQAPPNLNTDRLESLVHAGINDWGGVSPLTPDHVNPESPWPNLDALEQQTARAGKTLQPRLTIYPHYVNSMTQWLDPALETPVLKLADTAGLAREDDWLSGQSKDIPEGFGLRVLRRHLSPASGSRTTTCVLSWRRAGVTKQHCLSMRSAVCSAPVEKISKPSAWLLTRSADKTVATQSPMSSIGISITRTSAPTGAIFAPLRRAERTPRRATRLT